MNDDEFNSYLLQMFVDGQMVDVVELLSLVTDDQRILHGIQVEGHWWKAPKTIKLGSILSDIVKQGRYP